MMRAVRPEDGPAVGIVQLPEPLESLVNVHVVDEKIDKAIIEFNMAIQMNPDISEAYLYRGIAYEKTGETNKADSDKKKAKEFVVNLTSDEELTKLALARMDTNFRRDKGSGRPTKKERRMLDKYRE